MNTHTWIPAAWKSTRALTQMQLGDCVRNPVYADDTIENRELWGTVDAGLRTRGLRLDHVHTIIAFVVSV